MAKRRVDDDQLFVPESGLGFDTLRALSRQIKAATGQWGRSPIQKSTYHDIPSVAGLGDFSMAQTQNELSGGTPETEVPEAPTVSESGGVLDAPGAEVDFGSTAGEKLALEMSMDDVINDLLGSLTGAGMKAGQYTLAGYPQYALQGALANMVAPTQLAKTLISSGLPAGIAAEKYAPLFESIYAPYGEAYAGAFTGDELKSQIDDAMALMDDPETYALLEYHQAMPSPKDAQSLAGLYESGKKESRSLLGRVKDYLAELVSGEGDVGDAGAGPGYGGTGAGGETPGVGPYSDDPTAHGDIYDGGDSDVDLGGDTGGYGYDFDIDGLDFL